MSDFSEVDANPIPIFKNPKEGGFKKSQKGLCYVYKDEAGEIAFTDGYTGETFPAGNNMLETVFKDGRIVKKQTLREIRDLLNDNAF